MQNVKPKRNRWKAVGINAGGKIMVEYQQGRLVITKDEPKIDTRTE